MSMTGSEASGKIMLSYTNEAELKSILGRFDVVVDEAPSFEVEDLELFD